MLHGGGQTVCSGQSLVRALSKVEMEGMAMFSDASRNFGKPPYRRTFYVHHTNMGLHLARLYLEPNHF